jgi:hypothetical protein
MINQSTITKLNEMRLTAMADSYRDQLSDSKYQELSFEERLGLMVDIEWSRRKTNKLARLIRQAQFRFPEACMEDSKRQIHSDVNYNKSGSSTPSISQRALLTAILKSSSDMSLA